MRQRIFIARLSICALLHMLLAPAALGAQGRLGSDLTAQGATPAAPREAPRPGCAFCETAGLPADFACLDAPTLP